MLAVGLASSAQPGQAKILEVPGRTPTPPTLLVEAAADDVADVTVDGPPAIAVVATTETILETTPCSEALTWVAEAGLGLPAGVDYLCPSTMFAHQGTACWHNAIYCPGTGFIAVNMDLLHGTSTDYLRHVVAHEICHILDFQADGRTTEASADACAAAHGAPA